MNPYQPPQCTEPVAVTGEAPLMQVTYGLQYSLLFFFSGFVMLGVAILMAMTMEAGVKIVVLPAGAGVSNVAIAVLCLGRV